MADPLAPCPSSPNYATTYCGSGSRRFDPLPYTGATAAAHRRIKAAMKRLPRTTLVDEREDYLHYACRTAVGGYTDDVEFAIDADAALIHFRSASREGYWDLWVNPMRMRAFLRHWEEAGNE